MSADNEVSAEHQERIMGDAQAVLRLLGGAPGEISSSDHVLRVIGTVLCHLPKTCAIPADIDETAGDVIAICDQVIERLLILHPAAANL